LEVYLAIVVKGDGTVVASQTTPEEVDHSIFLLTEQVNAAGGVVIGASIVVSDIAIEDHNFLISNTKREQPRLRVVA
jgi:hypothetical protein